MSNLIGIFLTGLITGGLTCMAVQGGLLAASLAQREEEILENKLKNTGNAFPIVAFLTTKLIAYTILGFFLGLFGSIFQLSITARIIMQLVVVIFMVGTALNLLEVHPIFRYFAIQPPKFLTRFVRQRSKSSSIFAPAILGAFTIFIPCGTTQAMMALAIASGTPLTGALIMFSFILGTSPLFFILGYFTTKLGEFFQKKFAKVAAIAIILLALFNLNNALALSGIDFGFSKAFGNIICTLNPTCFDNSSTNLTADANNNPTIEITASGYNPNDITVRKGAKVKLVLKNVGGYSCAQAFTIPSLGIQKLVAPGETNEIDFTAPNTQTQIPFMCSMGMFRGVINVI